MYYKLINTAARLVRTRAISNRHSIAVAYIDFQKA